MRRWWIIITILLLALLVRGNQSHRFFYYHGDQSNDVAAARGLYDALATRRWSDLSPTGQEGIFYYLSRFAQPPHQPNVVYNGAAYYYFLLPAGILSSFHPYGFVAFLILLSLVGTWTLYMTGKLLFDETTGIIAATLHAVSFVILLYARIIWTPSPLPTLAALALLSFASIQAGRMKYWILLSFTVSLATQVHNGGYLLLGFILTLLVVFRPKLPKKTLLLLGTIFVFILPLLPTIWNEFTTGFLFPQAVLYQLWLHASRIYAGLPGWQLPIVLMRDVGASFGEFVTLVLFVGNLGREFAGATNELVRPVVATVGVMWIVAICLFVASRWKNGFLAIHSKQQALLCLYMTVWGAVGSFLAVLYYRSSTSLFWFNGVSVFIPFLLLLFAVAVRFAWRERIWRLPVLVTLVSFGFLQGAATEYTFWANTRGDVMYGHIALALRAVVADAEGHAYGLYVHAPSASVPSISAVSAAEILPLPSFVQGGYTCTNMKGTVIRPSRTYALLVSPEDESAQAQWAKEHSGSLISQGRIWVYKRE